MNLGRNQEGIKTRIKGDEKEMNDIDYVKLVKFMDSLTSSVYEDMIKPDFLKGMRYLKSEIILACRKGELKELEK